MDRNAPKQMTRYRSPILLLIIVTSAILTSDIVVMFLITFLPAISFSATAIIDSVLVVVLLFPVLYFSVFRQSRLHISELIEANEQLQTRITERNEAEHALKLERNKLKGILDAMQDGVSIIDQNYLIQYINPTVEKEFGPVNGRKCYEYFHDRMEICPWCKISKVSAGESIRSEQYFPKNEKTYEVFDTPLSNGDGAISKLAIFHDVSEGKKAEKALRESEERFRMLVETMNEGLGIIDENGVWTYVNDGLCSMLGYFPGDLIGRPVIEFADKTNQEVLKEQMARRRNGEWTPYEITYRSGYGKKRNVLVSPRPMFATDRQFRGSFAIITDITELKQTEESLRKSEAELRYLSSQLLMAQESERRRISRELHDELGQSLAVLKLQLSLTKKRLPDTLQHQYEEQMDSIDQIIENVRRLSRDLRPAVLDDLGLLNQKGGEILQKLTSLRIVRFGTIKEERRSEK